MHYVAKFDCEHASQTEIRLVIDLSKVQLIQEILGQGFRVCKTLDNRVHKARITQVLKANETFLIFREICKRHFGPFLCTQTLKRGRQS